MNLLESTEYYIWWLKKHYMLIPQRQIEEEVYQLIVKFNLHVEYDVMNDSYFDYLDSPTYLYLQELRRYGCLVDTYEDYLQSWKEYEKN